MSCTQNESFPSETIFKSSVRVIPFVFHQHWLSPGSLPSPQELPAMIGDWLVCSFRLLMTLESLLTQYFLSPPWKAWGYLDKLLSQERRKENWTLAVEDSKQEQRAPCINTFVLCSALSVKWRHLPEPSSAWTGVNLEMTQKDSWEQTRRQPCVMTLYFWERHYF